MTDVRQRKARELLRQIFAVELPVGYALAMFAAGFILNWMIRG